MSVNLYFLPHLDKKGEEYMGFIGTEPTADEDLVTITVDAWDSSWDGNEAWMTLVDGEVVVDKTRFYSELRQNPNDGYPIVSEQLALIYDDILNGTLDQTGDFFTTIKAVKDSYPKS